MSKKETFIGPADPSKHKWDKLKKYWQDLMRHWFYPKQSTTKPIMLRRLATFLVKGTKLKNRSHTTIKDWVKALDELQYIFQTNREKLEITQIDKLDMNTLGASTYLFYAQRILAKLRESYLTLHYRQDHCKNHKMLKQVEFQQANQVALKCYSSIEELLQQAKYLRPEQFFSETFINKVHFLESQAIALINRLHALNQFLYRQEALLQISQLEKNFLPTLIQSHLTQSGIPLNEMLMFEVSDHTFKTGDELRRKLDGLVRSEDILLFNKLISIYDQLKKCYVIARKSVIHDTLDDIGKDLNELGTDLSQINPQTNNQNIFNDLFQIYHKIESLRFSCNRDSHCSRNLAEKIKSARHQFRVACAEHAIGHAFLQQIAISPTSLEKPPKKQFK